MALIKKGLLYLTYKVSGKKIRYLPEFLHKKGVNVIEFRLLDEENSLITIDFLDLSKFFAICKNMCYNKRVVKYRGVLAPIAYVKTHLFTVIGVVLLTVITALLNNVVLGVKITGSGKIYSSYTQAVLTENNVSKYALFSSINYRELENEILSKNQYLSFVTVKKQGNVLVVDTQLSNQKPSVLGENHVDIVSNVNGVVEEIIVLRGTALVNKGDVVEKGQPLVGAFVTLKDESRVNTYTVARVKILQSVKYFYKLDVINEQNVYLAYALSKFKLDGEVVEICHEIVNGGIEVNVTLRHLIYGG